jgi:tRNA A37 threonylcarbamoyladenosine modification protein TsaB
VGIASAKTLAWTSALPLVGVATTEALRHAATLRCGPAAAAACVVLPAGAHDHYLDRPGAPAELVPAGRALAIAVGSAPAVAVELRPAAAAGLRGVEGLSAAELGEAAVQGLPAALLDIALPRLACGQVDDPAELVPRYVALPRGVGEVAARMAWSPDLR